MKKIKPWLVIALVFVAGFVAGVVVTRGVVRRVVTVALTNPDRVRDLIEKRVAARVKLDAVQREKVHRILAGSQGDLKELRRDIAPRFFIILSNAESQISTVLTPEQREKFEKLQEENRRLWHVPPGPK
ncbi:MAG: hypothetical protein EXS35_10490 [Pedosphaera sp.]|nr:hypothetical protein [Pedosphaera sp.]